MTHSIPHSIRSSSTWPLAASMAVLGLGLSMAAQAAPMFRLTLIESPRQGFECGVVAINDIGQIVQGCSPNAVYLRDAYGSAHRIRDHRHPDAQLAITGLNNQGVVLGTRLVYEGREAPFVWDATNGFTFLYSPAEKWWHVSAINDAGVVVGTSSEKRTDGSTPHGKAFKWTQGDHYDWLKPTKDRYTLARDINAQGQVAAMTQRLDGSVGRAVRFETDGSMTPLVAGPRASQATTINASGHVAGFMHTPKQRTHAFLWRPESGAVDIDGRDGARGEESIPLDMNDAGQMVGSMTFRLPDSPDDYYGDTVFYWDEATGMVDLLKLLDPSDPLTAEVARLGDWARINGQGQIIVNASTAGFKHLPLLLTPVQAR